MDDLIHYCTWPKAEPKASRGNSFDNTTNMHEITVYCIACNLLEMKHVNTNTNACTGHHVCVCVCVCVCVFFFGVGDGGGWAWWGLQCLLSKGTYSVKRNDLVALTSIPYSHLNHYSSNKQTLTRHFNTHQDIYQGVDLLPQFILQHRLDPCNYC